MDLYEKYDELDNIISTLDILIDEISDENYKEQLREIKWQAMNDLEELEPQIQKLERQEEEEMNYQFERSRL